MFRKYCKAYHLKDLRKFRNWAERSSVDEPELTDEAIVYLWDDFTVVRSPIISEKGLIFDTVSPEWQEFCKTTLGFEIPEDIRYAYKQPEEETGEKQSQMSV